MISLFDFGTGNLFSLKNALNYLDEEAEIIRKPEEIIESEKIIFPGVGNFSFVMKKLRSRNLIGYIKNTFPLVNPFWVFVWECRYCLKKVKREKVKVWEF